MLRSEEDEDASAWTGTRPRQIGRAPAPPGGDDDDAAPEPLEKLSDLGNCVRQRQRRRRGRDQVGQRTPPGGVRGRDRSPAPQGARPMELFQSHQCSNESRVQRTVRRVQLGRGMVLVWVGPGGSPAGPRAHASSSPHVAPTAAGGAEEELAPAPRVPGILVRPDGRLLLGTRRDGCPCLPSRRGTKGHCERERQREPAGTRQKKAGVSLPFRGGAGLASIA
jgi:hypothetical protein